MKIRNRKADVDALRCHVCQDFMKMVAVKDWRTILYPFIQNAVMGTYKDNYIEQYKIVRQKGIENYSFDDMDVPFISNVLQYGPGIAKISIETKRALKQLRSDRNTAQAHSSGNEAEEELYLQALVSLRDLQAFLHVVDFNETAIPDEKKSQYVQKFSKEIADLKLQIYSDCIEMFQIKKDIQLLLSSDDQGAAFLRMYQSYNEKANLFVENRTQMSRFLVEASNAGIKCAHGYAALVYEYWHDLDEATRRYEMMIDGVEKLSISDAHKLTDFVNHGFMTGREPTERMMRLVQLVKDQGFNIEVTSKGIFWKK